VKKSKCDYTIQQGPIIEKRKDDTPKKIKIGIAPKLAETIAGNALKHNLIKDLKVKTLQREKTFLNSRFDFIGKTNNNKDFILEVKNVPLADFEDIDSKERKTRIIMKIKNGMKRLLISQMVIEKRRLIL
jgi:hypothetical protein